MRFKSLRAVAFGPFKDRYIDLAPGLTVIAGSNGAGKSSMLAALYVGLCGIRRGGGLRGEDKEFQRRHRPWDDDKWMTIAEIVLDDGQRIELRYDLDRRVDCSAFDIDLGRDISSNIIYDGTPDGSRLVGLDRRSFARTACVGQAEILDVINAAGELQEHLQRAAASADRDATASRALATIDDFNSEFVGLDRRNSTKPLRAAKEQLDLRKTELEHAEKEHAKYLEVLVEGDQLDGEALKLERDHMLAEASYARAEAEALAEKVRRAGSLSREVGTRPPVKPDDDRELADVVTKVLSAYENFPKAPLSGEDPAALRLELSALPQETVGETTPDSDVLDTNRRLGETRAAAAEHARHRPAGSSNQAPVDVLSASRKPKLLWGVGAAALVLTALLLVLRQPVFAAISGAVLLIVTLGALTSRGPISHPKTLSDSDETFTWDARANQLASEVRRLEDALRSSLEARGYEVTGNLEPAYDRYITDCATRNRDALELSRKQGLEQRLRIAEDLNRQQAEYNDQRSQLTIEIEQVARRSGVMGTGGDLVDALRNWLRQRNDRLNDFHRTIAKWEELQGILQGESLADLEARSAAKANEATDLATQLTADERAALLESHAAPSSQEVRRLSDRAHAARLAAEGHAAQLRVMSATLPSVAEAKEALSQAETELQRVETLRNTLVMAKQFLEKAQEKVHRDIAPILAATLEDWLPVVTHGLYTRARVDPESLSVHVRSEEGDWRDATLLSHGTAEQIYLLLRIAMVDHLTKASSESCPLLLDDVTAHCDAIRATAIMELLHRISAQRQVIFFSQQDAVVKWAEAHLNPARDRLEILDERLIKA